MKLMKKGQKGPKKANLLNKMAQNVHFWSPGPTRVSSLMQSKSFQKMSIYRIKWLVGPTVAFAKAASY